jgi:type I restriction enzyme M protein
VPFITGVAGNDHTQYDVRTFMLVKGKYEPVTITGVEATGFLDPPTIQKLLDSGKPNVADFLVNESAFLKTAEFINRTLHIGGINKNDRAQVMAALLLALLGDSDPDVEADLPLLIGDINNRTRLLLQKHGKKEFYPFVKIEPPSSDENHVKYKTAIVRTIQALKNLSIKSAMNSGTDVLGKFYEVFLRYGNGAKEIGIVLTPRHVTRFAVETVGVSPNDVVFDPACGTGGFLVAAFDHVRNIAKPAQIEKFKKNNLWGIEQESKVAALAIVNMIFRGDGKNHIVEANCFTKFLNRNDDNEVEYVTKPAQKGNEPITKVFMNPPFALKKGNEKEWSFAEAAMKSVEDGGTMFVIVPMSVASEGGKDGAWRQTLLAEHTLLSVISFPEELFYPVANQTVGIIIKKGIAHPKGQSVLWARIVNDGFRKSKGKRLPIKGGGPTDLDVLKPILRAFLLDPTQPVVNVPELIRACPVDLSDPIMEIVPEAYLDSHVPTAPELLARLDAQVRENVSALVDIDLRYQSSERPSIIESSQGTKPAASAPLPKLPKMKPVPLEDLFELYAGDYHSLADEDPGQVPVVSCADTGNGLAGAYNVPDEVVYGDAITIAFNGWPLTTKLHPYAFAAKDDVAVAIPKAAMTPEVLIFIQAQLNAERWRFSYYRKCFKAKLGRTTVELPFKNGDVDYEYMAAAVCAQPYWWFLAPRLKDWMPKTSASSLETDEKAELAA